MKKNKNIYFIFHLLFFYFILYKIKGPFMFLQKEYFTVIERNKKMSDDIVELKKEILINEKKLDDEIKENKKLRLEYVNKN
jgi:hypothetical protein